jgi:hypothetical protein
MRRDGIEDEARALREAIRELERPHPTTEIPRELRSRVLTFVSRAKTVGWGAATVARAIGVSAGSIKNWRRDEKSLALVPVRLVPAVPGSTLRVVGPSGYRVEGLDVSTAALLLRALE